MKLTIAVTMLLVAAVAAPSAGALAQYRGPIYMQVSPPYCGSNLAAHPHVFFIGSCDGWGTVTAQGHWHHWRQWQAWTRVTLSIRRSCWPDCQAHDVYAGYAWVYHPGCAEYTHQVVKITGYREPYREPLRIGHTWRTRNAIGCASGSASI